MDNDPDYVSKVEPPGDQYKSRSPKFKPKKPFLEVVKKPFLIVISLLLVAGLVYGTWKFVLPKLRKSPPETQQNQPQPQVPAEPKSDIPNAENSETIKSDALRIEFKFPKAWKVSETEGGIRVISPDFSYKTTNGEKTGHFRIYMRKGAREVDGKYIGKGVVIKPSEKLTYSNPGLGQRKDTLISYFGIDNSDNFGFFLVAGNFQLNKGDTLGPSYGREPETFIITGGYSDNGLSDDLATNPVPINSLASSNALKQALEIIESIKL